MARRWFSPLCLPCHKSEPDNLRGFLPSSHVYVHFSPSVQVSEPSLTHDPQTNSHQMSEDDEKYKVGHPRSFHYLNQSNVYELDGLSNDEEYIKTRRAMDIVGISSEEQEAIFRTLAVILHLENIEFSPGKEHDSPVINNQQSDFHLQITSDLLRCYTRVA